MKIVVVDVGYLELDWSKVGFDNSSSVVYSQEMTRSNIITELLKTTNLDVHKI